MTVEEALRDERLGSLPLADPVSVSRGTSLGETLRLMRDEGAGCVLVCEDDRPIGIFTERDVLNKLIGSGVNERPSSAVGARGTIGPDQWPGHERASWIGRRMSAGAA